MLTLWYLLPAMACTAALGLMMWTTRRQRNPRPPAPVALADTAARPAGRAR